MPRAISQVFDFVTNVRGDTRKIERGFDDLEDKTADFGDAARDASDDAEDLEGGLFSLGGAADAAKLALGGLVVAGIGGAVGAIGTAIHDFTEISGAMNKFEAQTGISGKALEEYETTAKQLFKEGFGDGFTDVTEALRQVEGVTGLSGKALENATRDALIFSEVFDTDINEALRAADTAAENFGQSTGDSFNLLTAGIQRTGDPAGDLLDTFNEYSANFAALGFEGHEMLSILESGLDAGARNTDDIADGMREFGIRLKDGSSDLALWTLGLDGMNGAFKRGEASGDDLFNAVLEGLNDIEDPIKRNQLGVELFGTKWEDVGEQVFLALDPTQVALEDLEDRTNKAGEALQRGLGPTWERFQRTVRMGLVTALGPYIEKGLTVLLTVLQTLGTWLTGTGIPAFTQFLRTIGNGVQDVMAFVSQFVSLQDIGRVVSSVVDTIKGAFGDLRSAFDSGGLAGVGDLLRGWIEGIIDWVSAIDWSSIPGKLKGLLDKLLTMAEPIAETVYNKVLKPVIDFLKNVDWGEVVGKLADLYLKFLRMEIAYATWYYEHIIQPVIDYLKHIDWGEVAGKLQELYGKFLVMATPIAAYIDEHVLQPVIDYLKNVDWGSIAGTLADLYLKLLKMEMAIADWVYDHVIKPVIDYLGNINWGEVAGKLNELLGNLLSGDKTMTEWLSEKIWTPLTEGLGDSTQVQNVFDKAGEVAGEILKGLASGIGSIASWIKTNVIDAIKNSLTGGDGGGREGGGVKDSGTSLGLNILTGIASAFINIVTWIATNVIDPFIMGLTGESAADNFTKLLAAGISLAWGIINGIGGVFTTIKDWISEHVIDPIVDNISDVIGDVLQAGKDLGSALLEGMLHMLRTLPRDLIQLINDAIPDHIGIDFGWPLGALDIDIPDNPIPLPQLARGGLLNGVGITGEQGAELAFARQPTAILSHQKSVAALRDAFGLRSDGNGGGTTFHFYGDFNLPQVKTAREFLREMEREAQLQNKTLTVKRGLT